MKIETQHQKVQSHSFHRLKKYNLLSLDFYNITENRNPPPESSKPFFFHRLKKYIQSIVSRLLQHH